MSELSSSLNFQRNTKLYDLNLRYNMISDAGMFALAGALAGNTTLSTLLLTNYQAGKESAARLRQQLTPLKILKV